MARLTLVLLLAAACTSRVDFKPAKLPPVPLPPEITRTGMVKVRDTAGHLGTVPLAQLIKALEQGFSISDEDYPPRPGASGFVTATAPDGTLYDLPAGKIAAAEALGWSVTSLDADQIRNWVNENATPDQLERIYKN